MAFRTIKNPLETLGICYLKRWGVVFIFFVVIFYFYFIRIGNIVRVIIIKLERNKKK